MHRTSSDASGRACPCDLGLAVWYNTSCYMLRSRIWDPNGRIRPYAGPPYPRGWKRSCTSRTRGPSSD